MPSDKILMQKQETVDLISDKLKAAVSIVAVDYKGISVANDTALRAEMRQNNVEYFVIKNSILKYAFEKSGHEELNSILVGSTALAISTEDEVAPLKVVQKYADRLRDIYNTKKGYVGGRYIEPAEIKAITALPPRETLIAMVAGTFNGIIASFARAISEVAKQREEVA